METDTSQQQRFERANTLGITYLRTMVILNGGAILALLTFIGNASAQSTVIISVGSIQVSICLFLIGIVTMMVSLVTSYVHEAVAPGSRVKYFLSKTVITINALCGLASLIFFVLGVSFIISGAQPNQ